MKNYTTDMTVGNPVKHILLFALPALIGNVFQQLYNIADTAIVGRFVGANALAAVGATASAYKSKEIISYCVCFYLLFKIE